MPEQWALQKDLKTDHRVRYQTDGGEQGWSTAGLSVRMHKWWLAGLRSSHGQTYNIP